MIDLDMLPDSARLLVRAELERLACQLQDQASRIESQQRELRLKDETIRWLNLRLWGPKGEKLTPDHTQLLLAEPSVTEAEIAGEASRPAPAAPPVPKAKAPRANHPGRHPLPAHLERREVIVPCHPEDCRCPQCGAERPVIGYETAEELVIEPARFHVRVVKREKRGAHCLPEQGVATAPAPVKILPKSKLANETIIEVVVQKYQQHKPVYRWCGDVWENQRLELNRGTVIQEVLAVGGLLQAVTRAQRAELLAGHYLQADETPVPVQDRRRRGQNHKAFLWQYSVPGGNVVFDFQMSRAREGPKTFLQGFQGIVQSDGYDAYDKLGPGIEYAGCLTHVRRGFVEAVKLAPADTLPAELVQLLQPVYAVEAAARKQGLEAAGRLALRQAQSVPLLNAWRERMLAIRQQATPGSKLAGACNYAFNQWARVTLFLTRGEIEIDNNWCEGGMRPVVLGRKNWLHIGSEPAGPKVAAMASIVETCRRLEINLREYLGDILPRLSQGLNKEVPRLTPLAWKAARLRKT
jgi:transposase